MNATKWLNAVLLEYGESVDIKEFGFNGENAASMLFETGVSLRFEYAFESLVIAMQIPASQDPETMKRLLMHSQPERRPSFRLRVAYLEKAQSAMMVARLSEREANLAAVNAVFTELWLIAEDFRRRIS